MVECAAKLGRRVALVGVGGLSGTIFREEIDIARDHIAAPGDDRWNRRVLRLLESGDRDALLEACPKYARAARVDMGFKHLAWVLGGIGRRWRGATVHAYGPSWGAGAAVVEFALAPGKRAGKAVAGAKPAVAGKPAKVANRKKAAVAKRAPVAKKKPLPAQPSRSRKRAATKNTRSRAGRRT